MKFLAVLLIVLGFASLAYSVDVGALCAQYPWNQNCCRCIVQRESSGNPNASNGGNYIGLFQISRIHWPSCNGGNAPYDPQANLRCAIGVYKGAGNSWRPWSTARACGC